MLVEEEKIKQQLVERFGLPAEKITVQRERRIWADVAAANFGEIFDYAADKLGFVILATITGLDEGPTLGVIYHIARESGIILNLHISVPKDKPVIKTVSARFPAADAYEREMVDLLGMQVEGLPPGNRYPLPDGWPAGQYPLRKDWKSDTIGKSPVSPESQASRGGEVAENA
ncbi:MAG: NADH-quinone oxidoreductase subunit C [Sedimentisphaerales bacterium]|jgi:Ni,Fe-hydrogenase III component G